MKTFSVVFAVPLPFTALAALAVSAAAALAPQLPAQQPLATYLGKSSGDLFGSVVAAGDVNADGYPDIVASAPFRNGRIGEVLVFSGKDNKVLHTFAGSAGFDHFGNGIAVHDIDADGYADVLVGAPQSLTTKAGYLALYSGKTGKLLFSAVGAHSSHKLGADVAFVGDVDKDGVTDFAARSLALDVTVYSGASGKVIRTIGGNTGSPAILVNAFDGAGDVNGDGHADIVVGDQSWTGQSCAPLGRVVVLSGKDNTILIQVVGSPGDLLGIAVAGSGDVNNDNVPDFIAGAPQDHGLSRLCPIGPKQGYARVYSGKDGTTIHTFSGNPNLYGVPQFGRRLARLGDLDGDKVDDLAAAGNTAAGFGYVRLFSGKTGQLLDELSTGPVNDLFGTGLAAAGDFNRDGVPDIVTGAPGNDTNGSQAGRVQVWSGKVKLVLASYKAFGTGCGSGSGGSVIVPLLTASAPALGSNWQLDVTNLKPRTTGLLLFGFSKTIWGGNQLPLSLAFMGMPGCSLLVSFDVALPIGDQGNGRFRLLSPVPRNTAFKGSTFHNQVWVLDSAANAAGIATSNGGTAVIGL